jgi:septal ring factor EnvC (AmiA/AmiB activator)
MPSRHLETALECLNKNVDMKVSEYDAYLEKPSSGMTLIIKRLEENILKKFLRARHPKDLNRNPKDINRNRKDLNRKQKDLNRNPKDLNRNPKDLNRNRKDLNRNPKDLNRNPKDLNRNRKDLNRNPKYDKATYG